MKNLLKKSVFALGFAFAFVFGAAATVKAAEPAMNNTIVEGATSSYNAGENDYYVLNTKKESASLVLKVNNGSVGYFDRPAGAIASYYTAKVSVIKCANADCSSAKAYNVNSGDEAKNIDALRQLDGKKLTITLRDELFSSEVNGTVNGQALSGLTSVYGATNTYFVIVEYKRVDQYPFFIRRTVEYTPDVVRVVLTENISGLSITHTNDGDTARVTVTSGTPINTVRYFHQTAELPENYDFANAYAAAEHKTQKLSQADSNPAVTADGKFVYTFSIDKEAGEHYYVEATDVAGRKTTYDVSTGTEKKEENKGENKTEEQPISLPSTKVGKIILIVLIVVFVIALTLVIIQKIVDYRKRLY